MRHAGGVLLLSGVLGRQMPGDDGRPRGRITDLAVRLDGGAPETVTKLVLRRAGGTVLVPWGQPDVVADGLDADEILLHRDVLDTQVVDVVGQRLARVADVLLCPVDSGRMEVVGVEVGFGGVLRRLGLGAAVPGRRQDVVAWHDLHLTSERGESVQLSASRSAVHRLDPRGLASLVSRVDTDSATEILTTRDPALAAQAVWAAHPEVSERLLRAMPRHLAARIIAAMPGERAHHWRRRLARTPRLLGRRFLRSRVWPRRRHLDGE